MKIILPICLMSLLFCGCRKDLPPVPDESEPPAIGNIGGRLMILNEGNFMMGNAALSEYRATDKSTREDVYREANQRALGDVAQSMSLIGDELWVVVNNSGKLVILDTGDFKEKAVIDGMLSPRFMLPANGKILVSDLYAGKIHLLDAATRSITGFLPFHTWGEELAGNDAGVWISAPYKPYLYRTQTPFSQVTDSLEVGYHCAWLEQEPDGIISGLSAGQGNERPRLWSIDKTGRLISSMDLPFPAQTLHDLEYVEGSHYFLSPEGLFRADSSGISLAYPAAGRNFYSMTYLESWNLLAVSDARDYVSKGEVILLRIEGRKVSMAGKVSASIIPGRMLLFDK